MTDAAEDQACHRYLVGVFLRLSRSGLGAPTGPVPRHDGVEHAVLDSRQHLLSTEGESYRMREARPKGGRRSTKAS